MLDTSFDTGEPRGQSEYRVTGAALENSLNPCGDQEQDLILSHMGFAEAIARRYTGRAGDPRDIRQVALLGLVKAAKRFEPDKGFAFAAFAGPTIAGEIKRHLRDTAWTVRPPRSLQELALAVASVAPDMEQALGREPTHEEIAEHLSRDVADVVAAISGSHGMFATPLDSISDSSASTDSVDAIDSDLELHNAVQRLPRRDRVIVYMRFYEGRNQREIAEELGMSQMQVSRAITKLLRTLRTSLSSSQPEEHLEPSV